MKTLGDWKAKTVGWRVGIVRDDTDGLGATEYVIYDGGTKKVYRSSTPGGVKTEWGTITKDTASSVAGMTSGSSSYHFRITCSSGELKGELARTAFLVGRGLEEKARPVDPPPGSWTAAEGGGNPFEGERKKPQSITGAPQQKREAHPE